MHCNLRTEEVSSLGNSIMRESILFMCKNWLVLKIQSYPFKGEDTDNKHFSVLGGKPDGKWKESHCNITVFMLT
jgi:hypothetical protein